MEEALSTTFARGLPRRSGGQAGGYASLPVPPLAAQRRQTPLSLIRLLLALLLFCHLPLSARADHPVYHHSVLIVHSYHHSMQWVQEVQQGIEEELQGTLGDDVDIKVEYMDSKRYQTATNYRLLKSLWRHKYQDHRPDCLIVCDDNALAFLLPLRDEIFPEVPLVFCGINDYAPLQYASYDNITGVVEAYDLRGTLDIIRELLPATTELFIINDKTTTGKANAHRLETIVDEYADYFRFHSSGVPTRTALAQKVAALPDNAAILLLSFNRDAEGSILRYRDAVRLVRQNSARPIFSVWSFYLDRGIVGGSLVHGQSQGRMAGKLAIRILQGAPASSLPVVRESPNLPMFDYEELRRFNIALSELPPNSHVINRPDDFWYRHKYSILAGISFILLQTLIIALLIYNIQGRKKSQQRLLKSQRNLAITLESIAKAVISINRAYTITQANPSAAKLLETPQEELPGRYLPEVFYCYNPGNDFNLINHLERCCLAGEIAEFPEGTHLRPANKPSRQLSGSCSPIRDQKGAITGAVLICHDITERESMRAMLAHSQKMEALGQLAGGVAHDFNNQLAGISGFAEILSMQLQGDGQKLGYAGKILEAASRAKELTRQLLSFARKGKVVSSPIDCHEALSAAISLLERSIDKKINLETALEAKHSVILGDPVQLENTFLNLAINGADAMEHGGTLRFTTLNITLEEPMPCEFGDNIEPGYYLLVSVADNGCGIDPESRHAIFEPFYTTKKEGEGTGLGLSTVFGTMKEHGSYIQLLSEKNVGTEFRLFFHVTEEKQVDLRRKAPLRGGTETILIVDDERLVLTSTKALLKELGYQVLVAEGGREGVDLFARHKEEIDLVILDMIMPEMDGATCFSRMQAIDPGVKVIISSGFSKSDRVREIEKLGVHGFLQKPYSASSLNEALRTALHPEQKQ